MEWRCKIVILHVEINDILFQATVISDETEAVMWYSCSCHPHEPCTFAHAFMIMQIALSETVADRETITPQTIPGIPVRNSPCQEQGLKQETKPSVIYSSFY